MTPWRMFWKITCQLKVCDLNSDVNDSYLVSCMFDLAIYIYIYIYISKYIYIYIYNKSKYRWKLQYHSGRYQNIININIYIYISRKYNSFVFELLFFEIIFLSELNLNDISGLPEWIFKFLWNWKKFSKANIAPNKQKSVGRTQKIIKFKKFENSTF